MPEFYSPSISTNPTMNPTKEHSKNKHTINANDKNNKRKLQNESILLTGLPNHLAELCLLNLQPSLLYNVCLSWRHLIYSPSFPPFLSLYALVSKSPSIKKPQLSCDTGQCVPNGVGFVCFDPISSKWKSLPNLPSDQPLCLIRKHPSFISRILPIQSVTVSGRLVLLSATSHKLLPALDRPLVFDPQSRKWYCGPEFSTPRRWCVAGSVCSKIYFGSGTGERYNADVARSFERWDVSGKECKWEKRAPFRDGKFSREAVEAVGFKGKLYMVNINGKAVKEGAVYDVVMDIWEEMPRGMLTGWNGPVTADDDDDIMYVVDQEKGSISTYDVDNDCWEVLLIEDSECLKGVERISVCRGKLCAVFADGLKIVVVDILAKPSKIWMVNPPQQTEVISVHILPRTNLLDHYMI